MELKVMRIITITQGVLRKLIHNGIERFQSLSGEFHSRTRVNPQWNWKAVFDVEDMLYEHVLLIHNGIERP